MMRPSSLSTRAILSLLASCVLAALVVLGWSRLHAPTAVLNLPPGAPDGAGAPGSSAPARSAAFVGRSACVPCHVTASTAWTGSHHDLAMQEAAPSTVLGNFRAGRFTHAGVTTTFSRRDDAFYVRTDGPDGAMQDYQVRYVFGVAPLQQYLLALPDGRLQALSVAWDTRPSNQGGGRWFHLYPDERISHGDRLHWTKPAQNWNAMCADCHSTNVQRNFDPASRRYRTGFTDIDVACEACHGPGSEHVAWAARGASKVEDLGLLTTFDERRGVTWSIDNLTGNARRSQPRATSHELDACSRCHSRRGELGSAVDYDGPLGQAYRLALLDDPLYFVDGQIRDEVYEYGSFLESRMHAAGVTCSDCHDPHSLTLRAPEGTVCLQCHDATKYRSATHHHHRDDSPGAACIACHMPARTYMVVHVRHDHSFRIPRPDRSLAIGVPNVCTDCHHGKTAGWAASSIRTWFPVPKPGFQRFAEALAAGAQGAPGSQRQLLALADDATEPAIARASALQRVAPPFSAATLATLRRALAASEPLVRRAAAGAFAMAPDAARGDLEPALDDAIRDVRLEAARWASGHSPQAERAREEYIASQRALADRPEAQSNLGAFYVDRRRPTEAKEAFERALRLDPTFIPAAINLADLERTLGNDAEGEPVLRRALALEPTASVLHQALGLWLTRAGRKRDALEELRMASRLAPDEAQTAFVYALALLGAGRAPEAIQALEGVVSRHPYHVGALRALTELLHPAEASGYADRLLLLLRDGAEVPPH